MFKRQHSRGSTCAPHDRFSNKNKLDDEDEEYFLVKRESLFFAHLLVDSVLSASFVRVSYSMCHPRVFAGISFSIQASMTDEE